MKNITDFGALMDRWLRHGEDVKALRGEFIKLILQINEDETLLSVLDQDTNRQAACAAYIATIFDGQELEPREMIDEVIDALKIAGFRVRLPGDPTFEAEEEAHRHRVRWQGIDPALVMD